jgi:hypothetical protein
LSRLPAVLPASFPSRLAAGSDRPLVFLVPAAHGDPSHQRRLSDLLKSLASEPGLRLVGLAGAAGPLAVDPLRRGSDETLRRSLADRFLASGDLTGAEHAALTVPGRLRVTGLEDPARLATDAGARRAFRAREAEARRSLLAFRAALRLQLDLRGTPALRALVRRRDLWRRGEETFSSYLAGLESFVPGGPAAGSPTAAYRSLAAREAAADAGRAAQERDDLVRRLAERLDPPALDRLAADALAFRLGALTAPAFHASLFRAAETADLTPGDALREYVALLRDAELIDPAALADDLARREDAAAERAAPSGPAAAIWGLLRDADAFDALFEDATSPRARRALAERGDRLTRTRDLWRRAFGASDAPAAFPSDFAAPCALRAALAAPRRAAVADRAAALLSPGDVAVLVVPPDWIAPLGDAFSVRGIDHASLSLSASAPPAAVAADESLATDPDSPRHAAFRRAWWRRAVAEAVTAADPVRPRLEPALPRARFLRRLARRTEALFDR